MCNIHQLFVIIFFRYFKRFCFVWIISRCLDIFYTPFFCPYRLVYFSDFYSQSCLLLLIFSHFIPFSSCVCCFPIWFVIVVSLFVLSTSFFFCVLYFCSDSLGEYQFYHWLVLLLRKLTSLVRWCYPLWYVLIRYLLFRLLLKIFLVQITERW